MNVSYGYTHSTFKKYDGGTTSSEEQIDYSGNYVPFVPRHTMNAGANYSFFFDKSNWMQSLTLGMSYTGAGKIYWTEKNNVSQSFYGTLNGRISLQTKALQIDVWGRNLTNKDYTTFYFETMHRGFEQKAAKQIAEITASFSSKLISDPKFMQMLKNVYMQTFTEEEVLANIQFLETPLGQSINKKSSKMMSEIMRNSIAMSAEMMQDPAIQLEMNRQIEKTLAPLFEQAQKVQ
jgi:hypothetical protein